MSELQQPGGISMEQSTHSAAGYCFSYNNSLFPSPTVLARNVLRQQGRGNVALAAITRLGRELAKNVGKEEVDLHSPPEAALLFAMHCICKG